MPCTIHLLTVVQVEGETGAQEGAGTGITPLGGTSGGMQLRMTRNEGQEMRGESGRSTMPGL